MNRGASYLPLPQWLKDKMAVVNPKNTNDNLCFVYAAIIVLYHQQLGSKPERISTMLKTLVSKFNWKNLDFPTLIRDYKMFERNNEDLVLNILYVPAFQKEIQPEYISKHNFT